MIFIGIYNGQKIANEEAGSAWGNVEATQQRRADLVPNLVATVKAYASHEEGTFTAVTEARAKVGQINLTGITGDSAMMAKLFAAQGELSSALSKLMVVAEDYPELKASENFRDLQSQLEGTENRINVARQRYNESAQTVNSSVETFFGAIVAGFSGVEKREYFKASEKAQEVPVVDFE
ncbi:LemA family protein [Patescibacteria group bacterium]|nr:LemA family protein [Patescibacteria group bacterium]MBU2260153.1 LemA family protein [Patescibacteria group bacterium]